MDKNKDLTSQPDQNDRGKDQQSSHKQRSSAFREPPINEEKSTHNPEEEAELEQERKEAMTERD
jgi:hypothetical protein